jgi:hypothetical protein
MQWKIFACVAFLVSLRTKNENIFVWFIFMAGRFSVVVRSAQHVKGLELKFWRFEI